MESSKGQHLFVIEIFYMIINVFTGTFDHINLSMLKNLPKLCVCVCVCVCGHVYVVYEDTNLYNDMGIT